MSQHDHAAPQAHSIKPYLIVFGTLMVLTVVTVAVSHLDLSRPLALFVGISIAVVKASLVALFFMHLKGERALIWGLLGLCAVFTLFLFSIPWFDSWDNLRIERTQHAHVSAGNHGAAHEETGTSH